VFVVVVSFGGVGDSKPIKGGVVSPSSQIPNGATLSVQFSEKPVPSGFAQ